MQHMGGRMALLCWIIQQQQKKGRTGTGADAEGQMQRGRCRGADAEGQMQRGRCRGAVAAATVAAAAAGEATVSGGCVQQMKMRVASFRPILN